MKRVAVIGAAGFVGANLMRALAAAGHEPIGVVAGQSSRWRLADTPYSLRETSGDPASVVDALADLQPELVVNTAAHGAYPDQGSLERMCTTNIVLVDALATWCTARRVALLHLGSSSEYGVSDQPPGEAATLRPNSTYATTKAAGTHIVCDAVRRHGLVATVFRLYSVYGRWEEPSRLMPTVAAHAAARMLPPRLVSPHIARDFVHIDDVASAVLAWTDRPRPLGEPSIVNIGSGTQTTIGEVIELVRRITATDEQPNWGSMEPRRWDTDRWQCDPSKAGEQLGWRAETPLDTGIRDLIDFVAAHPDRYPAPRPDPRLP